MDMLKLDFLRINAFNYWFLLRERGLFYVTASLMAGIRTHLCAGRSKTGTRLS
jgi:hypothetical protein